jgi:penicillin-binding protein 1A
VRDDKPIVLKGWKPENYTHDYRGPVTLTQALAQSLNTVSVRLTLEFGPVAVAKTAYRLGIASKLEANPSIALGTSEVSLIELVSAYAPFANGGDSTARTWWSGCAPMPARCSTRATSEASGASSSRATSR